MTELKPCPFCGGEFKYSQEPHDNYPVAGMWYAYHTKPGFECHLDFRGHFDTIEELVTAWNTRAGEKDITDELVEVLEEAEVLACHALTSSTLRLRGRWIKVRDAKERIRVTLSKYKEPSK